MNAPPPTAPAPRQGPPLLSRGAWILLGFGLVLTLAGFLLSLSLHDVPLALWPQYLFRGSWKLLTGPGLLSELGVALIFTSTLILILMAIVASAMRTRARQQALGVVGYVSAAVRVRMPLPLYLRSAAESESNGLARRLRRTAAMIERGESVGTALRANAGELPPLMLDRIAAAEQSLSPGGGLSETIDRQRMRFATREVTNPIPAYAIMTAGLILLVNSMVMIFIIPKYAQIFRDFHLALPRITQALIELSRITMVSLETYSLTILIAIVVVVVLLARSIGRSATASPGPFWPRWLGRIVGRLVWATPFLGRIVRDRHAALACEALAEGLRAGRPMPEAIAAATLPSLNPALRGRLIAWRHRVAAGEPTAPAARATKVPTLLAELLAGEAVQQGDNAANVVEFAGRTYAALATRRTAALSAVVPVVTTLVLAVGVGFVALAMFTPIATLIQSLG